MSTTDGQIDPYARSIWTILSIMMVVILLSVFFVKKIFFNSKIYGKFPFLENYKNREEITILFLIGTIVFFLILISWNPLIIFTVIGVSLAVYAIVYMISRFMPS